MALGELALGWLMGLLSPGIVSKIAGSKRRSALRRAFDTELVELQFTLCLVAFRLFRRTRGVTRDRISMLRDVVTHYSGPEEDTDGLRVVQDYLALPEDQQLAVAARATETTANSPRLVKYSTPFLDAHSNELLEFPVDYQWRVTQILRDLRIFNDGVDQSCQELARTFDVSITGPNRQALQTNIENTYASAATRVERLIREIGELRRRYPSRAS